MSKFANEAKKCRDYVGVCMMRARLCDKLGNREHAAIWRESAMNAAADAEFNDRCARMTLNR